MNRVIADIAKEKDSFYLYDESAILERIERMKSCFPSVEFLYSVKCNPNRNVVETIFTHGFGADAASLNEVLLANECGLREEQIMWSAPGKASRDIREALDKSLIIADSIDEIKLIDEIAKSLDRRVDIGVRINPDFSYSGKGGHPSKFGIDEKQMFDFLNNNNCSALRITGIHVHVRSQELNTAVLAEYHKNVLDLAERFKLQNGGRLEFVNLGSGIGAPFAPNDREVDLEYLGRALAENLQKFRANNPEVRIVLETGRYTTVKSGVYVSKVLDRKISYGKTYIVLKNTLNGFIRPSIEKLVSIYTSDPMPAMWEPLFTCRNEYELKTLRGVDEPTETVTLVGNLCTGTDVVAEDIEMPVLKVGDVVVFTNAGAYAAVITPMQFSYQEKPTEVFLSCDGSLKY